MQAAGRYIERQIQTGKGNLRENFNRIKGLENVCECQTQLKENNFSEKILAC
jgi:hypothetical protein